ncbi:MAG: IMPACT family protein [Thermotogota bacterium]
MSYKSIFKNQETKINIKRSEFIGNCAKVDTEEQAKDFIKEINDKYKNANHNCWAYYVKENRFIYNFSDNGEPSGTAGKPIHGEIQKHDLENIVIVITRFFGGIKLGVRGLIEAYSQTAAETLKNSNIVQYRDTHIFKAQTDYSNYSEIERFLKREIGWKIEKINYTDKVDFEISIDEKKLENLKKIIENRVSFFKFQKIEEKPYKVRD